MARMSRSENHPKSETKGREMLLQMSFEKWGRDTTRRPYLVNGISGDERCFVEHPFDSNRVNVFLAITEPLPFEDEVDDAGTNGRREELLMHLEPVLQQRKKIE